MKKFQIEVTEEEMNAIHVEQAYANSEKASPAFMEIVKSHGDRIALRTVYDLFAVTEFNGQLYA